MQRTIRGPETHKAKADAAGQQSRSDEHLHVIVDTMHAVPAKIRTNIIRELKP